MKPDFEKVIIGDCTLYLGDCIDLMQTFERGNYSSIITDPVWPNCPADLIPGSEDPYGLFDRFCSVVPSVDRTTIVMRHDSDPRFLEPVKQNFCRTTILPYVMPSYIGRYLGGDEIAYSFGTPVPSSPGQRVIPGRAPAVQPGGRPPNGHPCSRALEHFKFLVKWWSVPGETVFDPFMGSATTGVASVLMGRKFIGMEIDRDYFRLACRRIEGAVNEPQLFTEADRSTHQMELIK